jgi:DNA modification methylase
VAVTWTGTRDEPVAALQPYPGNARRGNVETIRASIRRFGQYRAVVVRDTGDALVVLAGNHTIAALQAEGHQTARCEVVTCTDDEARRINLADNRTADLGWYDDADLAALLGELDGDFDATGWGQCDLDALLAPGAGPGDGPDPDQVPEPPAVPVTRPGDIWQLGGHRVICGDCRDPAVVARLLGGTPANLAFTSPPYAAQRTYDQPSGFEPVKPGDYADWFEPVQAGVRAVLAADGSWFVNIKEHSEGRQRHLYVKDLTIAHVRRWGWRFVDELCWDTGGFPGKFEERFKNGFEPVFHFAPGKGKVKHHPWAVAHASGSAFRYDASRDIRLDKRAGYVEEAAPRRGAGLALPSNVIRVSSGGDGSHTAAFPVALPAWFIRAYCDPGDAVLDPFMGSGSTLIAAHREGRAAYGCEISPAYCDVICERFEAYAGTAPQRVI